MGHRQENAGHLGTTFESVATLYDEARPGYPEQLLDACAQYGLALEADLERKVGILNQKAFG